MVIKWGNVLVEKRRLIFLGGESERERERERGGRHRHRHRYPLGASREDISRAFTHLPGNRPGGQTSR